MGVIPKIIYFWQVKINTELFSFTLQSLIDLCCLQDLTSELNDLEGRIFDAYIEQKADPLIAYVEPGMTICDFKWHNCLPPSGDY